MLKVLNILLLQTQQEKIIIIIIITIIKRNLQQTQLYEKSLEYIYIFRYMPYHCRGRKAHVK